VYFKHVFIGECQSSRSAYISSILNDVLNCGSFVNLADLCIDASMNIFWHVYVDLNILNWDGVSLDACVLALVAAFQTGHLPVATTEVRTGDHTAGLAEQETARARRTNVANIVVVRPEVAPVRLRTTHVPVVADFLILNRLFIP